MVQGYFQPLDGVSCPWPQSGPGSDRCRGAKRVFSAALKDARSMLPPKAHVLAVRMHLNHAPVDHMSSICFCGHALQYDPWHWLSCDHMKAVAMTAGHNGIVQTLANWITRVGGACDIEPRQVFNRPDRPNQRRADLRVALGVDVAVIHPTSAGRIGSRPALIPLSFCKRRESQTRYLRCGRRCSRMHVRTIHR
jgi:hypothetical protein